MIVVTGAAGFIGSCIITKLNQEGHTDLIIVDDFSSIEKIRNLANKRTQSIVHRDDFLHWFKHHGSAVEAVFHIGARTDTTEVDYAIFQRLNGDYSGEIWKICAQNNIRLIYASSAATYGNGQLGFDDDHAIVSQLQPLNAYGISKNEFDKWALAQPQGTHEWVGFKFFNVFGPNEYHKGRMASVVWHTFQQIKNTGKMRLFRSHHPDFKDGEQKRDFVYVKDVVNTCYAFFQGNFSSGLYNLGAGEANTFLSLAINTFKSFGLEPSIEFVDTPVDIRDNYQYFTCANMEKAMSTGLWHPSYPFKKAIQEYVIEYLKKERYY